MTTPSKTIFWYLIIIPIIPLKAFGSSISIESPRQLLNTLVASIQDKAPPIKDLILENELSLIDAEIVTNTNFPYLESSLDLRRRLIDNSDSSGAGLRIGFPLYDFGRSKHKSKALESKSRILIQESSYQKWMIKANVAKLVTEIIKARNSILVSDQVVILQSEKTNLVKSLVQKGLKPTYDFKLALIDLEEARHHSFKSHAALEDAVRTLHLTLADSLPSNFEDLAVRLVNHIQSKAQLTHSSKEDHEKQGIITTPSKSVKSPQDWLKKTTSIISQKVDWQAKMIALKKESIDLKAQAIKAENHPKVDGQLAADFKATEKQGQTDQNNPSYTALISVKWMIPWKNQTNLELRKLHLEKSRLEETLNENSKKHSVILTQLKARLTNLEQRWQHWQSLYRLRIEAKEQMEDRYRSGQATSLEQTQMNLEVIRLLHDQVALANEARTVALLYATYAEVGPLELLLEDSWDGN